MHQFCVLEKVGSRKKTKLVAGKLEKGITEIEEDSATRLFNGVSLIWSAQINIGDDIEVENESDFADREFGMQQHDMGSIRVSPGSVPDQELDDDAVGDDVGTITGKGTDFCIEGDQKEGKNLAMKENYLEVREVATNRLCCRKAVNTFFLEKVEEIKMQSSSTVGTENEKIDAV